MLPYIHNNPVSYLLNTTSVYVDATPTQIALISPDRNLKITSDITLEITFEIIPVPLEISLDRIHEMLFQLLSHLFYRV